MTTRLAKGELSPLLEGSPDLAAYFEGGSTVENFKILRQGGIQRWEGTNMIQECKDSTKDAILLPFEFSVDDAYVLEVGDLYIRVYKNTGAPVLTSAGGPPVEIVTPFAVADIRTIHVTQSADVLFMFHGSYQQRKLSRVSDTNWSLSTQTGSPPPSFEADTDISPGASAGLNATLTPASTTGNAVVFTASQAVFYQSDVGRQIIYGASRAVITAFGASAADTTFPNRHVRADILDAFPNTSPIASGYWLMRLSPQCTLDPNIKEPIGAQVTLVASLNAFRPADVGKYINIYGGIVKITIRDSATQVRGTVLSVMGDATIADPAAAPAGAWSLEVASWSTANGWPRTGEFFQGRLYEAATTAEPTAFWGSRSDDFDNFAIGITAEDSVNVTMASRQVNRIEWLAEKGQGLMIGTAGSEQKAIGSGNQNALISGSSPPTFERLATNGCAPIQPIMARKSMIYIDRSRRKVMVMGYDLESDGDTDKEASVGSEHITLSGVRLGPMAFEKRLNPRLYFVTEDGVLVAMTFFPEQKVVAFSRRTTQGTFESVACIPTPGGGNDEVWVIVKRTINGVTKRFVELFMPGNPGTQTDCSVGYQGSAVGGIAGVTHLEGMTVDVQVNQGILNADGNQYESYIGQRVVTGGAIALEQPVMGWTVGLHYDSTATTMRPAIPGTVIEGLPRSWDSLFLRVKDTIGGTINGEPIQYPAAALDTVAPYTGDTVKVTVQATDTEGRITVQQTQPYNMTVLAMFGTLSIGEYD